MSVTALTSRALLPEPRTRRQRRTSATGRERIDSLDGLRAFALIIIMGYHFGVPWLQGGFFSLDIFYVLSGYLITGLLLGEYARRGSIVLSAFWLRRARRLLPALLVVLVAVTLMVRFGEPAGTGQRQCQEHPQAPIESARHPEHCERHQRPDQIELLLDGE